MSSQSRRESFRQSWGPFLPQGAILMARRPVSPATSTHAGIRVEGLLSSSLVLLVRDSILSGSPQGQLLGKMLEAIGLRLDTVLFALSEGQSSSSAVEKVEDLLRGKEQRVFLSLGETSHPVLDALGLGESGETLERGLWRELPAGGVLLSWSPAQLLQRPELKREAWADLQGVARRLGLELPARPTRS
jgi:hypothetical protein